MYRELNVYDTIVCGVEVWEALRSGSSQDAEASLGSRAL